MAIAFEQSTEPLFAADFVERHDLVFDFASLCLWSPTLLRLLQWLILQRLMRRSRDSFPAEIDDSPEPIGLETSDQTLGLHAPRLSDVFELSDLSDQAVARAHRERERVPAITLALPSLAQRRDWQLFKPGLEANLQHESSSAHSLPGFFPHTGPNPIFRPALPGRTVS